MIDLIMSVSKASGQIILYFAIWCTQLSELNACDMIAKHILIPILMVNKLLDEEGW